MKKLSFFLMAMLLTLCVTNAFGEVYFSDSFSNVGTGSNATVSSRTGWSSLTQCYGQYNSGLRIGSSKNAGSITKTAMSNISGTKNLKVTIYTAKYNNDGNSFTITATNGTITSVTGVGKLSAGTLTVSPTGNAGVTGTTSKATWTDSYKTEFIISGATSSTTIKFATNKRAILGPITIEDEAASGDDEIETVDLGDLLKWSATSATVTVGADDNEFPTLTNTNDVAVSYTSSTPATATIDASTGAITLVAAGTTTISAFYEGGDDAGEGKVYAAKTVSYTLTVKPAPLVIEPIEGGIIDILTHGNFGANSNSYANFTGKQAANDGHSTAVYAGRTARNGDATQYNVQLNTIDKGRIATTTTGGLAKRVYVRWASQTANTNNRALYIYGSNDAFTGGETTDPSTKIGIVTFTTGAEEAYADLTGDYKHILITGSGAIYMDEIQVTWVSAEGTVVTPTISGDAEFIESTEISISAEDGLKVYYTLDGTDPTNASTEYTAPFTVSATTTVKAVAYDGENASDIASQTFKKLQVLTCEEAADACKSTESADKYVIRGYVTNVKYAYNEEYKTATFWIADTKDGGQVLQAYSAKPVAEIDKAVKVGDYVEAIGNLKLYNETPEITNGTYTIIPAPVVNHTITLSANPAEAGTVTGGGEYEEGATATLTATANEGYEFVKWTENEVEVSTDAEYTFEVLADRAIVANFELIPPTKFTVTVTAENGTVEGAGEYEEGAEATLTATAAEGYKFVNWTVGETVVSTENPYKFTVTADVALVANFDYIYESVYFINTKEWDEVWVYVWNEYGNNEWPGMKLDAITTFLGYDVYGVAYPLVTGITNVIFNNGNNGEQTDNLEWTPNNFYMIDGWYTADELDNLPFTVTGSSTSLFGSEWDPTNTDNDMVEQADGTTYRLVKENVTLAAGNIEYKVAVNHSWDWFTYPEEGNVNLNIPVSGRYNVTFTLDLETAEVTATAELLEEIVVLPAIAVKGAWDGWANTTPLVLADNNATASVVITISTAGDYEFGINVDGQFTANGAHVTRDANDVAGLEGNSGNMLLSVDEAGDYTFTWTYATKTLVITFPTVEPEVPTALDNIDSTVAPVKAIVNGQLIIIKNGVQYNAQGAVVK